MTLDGGDWGSVAGNVNMEGTTEVGLRSLGLLLCFLFNPGRCRSSELNWLFYNVMLAKDVLADFTRCFACGRMSCRGPDVPTPRGKLLA